MTVTQIKCKCHGEPAALETDPPLPPRPCLPRRVCPAPVVDRGLLCSVPRRPARERGCLSPEDARVGGETFARAPRHCVYLPGGAAGPRPVPPRDMQPPASTMPPHPVPATPGSGLRSWSWGLGGWALTPCSLCLMGLAGGRVCADPQLAMLGDPGCPSAPMLIQAPAPPGQNPVSREAPACPSTWPARWSSKGPGAGVTSVPPALRSGLGARARNGFSVVSGGFSGGRTST